MLAWLLLLLLRNIRYDIRETGYSHAAASATHVSCQFLGFPKLFVNHPWLASSSLEHRETCYRGTPIFPRTLTFEKFHVWFIGLDYRKVWRRRQINLDVSMMKRVKLDRRLRPIFVADVIAVRRLIYVQLLSGKLRPINRKKKKKNTRGISNLSDWAVSRDDRTIYRRFAVKKLRGFS